MNYDIFQASLDKIVVVERGIVCFLIDWLIDCYLKFSGKYFMHIQDKNKFNNVKAIIQNEEEMGHYWGQHIIQLYRIRKKWDNGGQHILTATGKVWRVWVGIKIICPCVAVPMWLPFQNLQRNLEHVALSKQDTHYGPLVASCFITWQPLIERASHFCHLWTFWAALRVIRH